MNIPDTTIASIFASLADNLRFYNTDDLRKYAVNQGLCSIDRHLLAQCGQHYDDLIPPADIRVIRKRFQSYLRDVLDIEEPVARVVIHEPTQAVTAAPVTEPAQNVTGGVGFKAFRNRSVLNRGRTFPSYEKARQYIRRHITAHVGADNYNDDERITMPVDDVNRNYPNITALGYAIKKGMAA